MSILEISPSITTRFREVQEVLAFIKRNESSDGRSDDVGVVLTRGLFYVHLYSAFEYSINRIVQSSVAVINAESVPHIQIPDSLGVLTLNRSFNSLREAGTGKEWRRRLELFDNRRAQTPAKIDDGTVELQNVWLETIVEVFAIFGVSASPMYDVAKSGYIREVVDTRNKISHGRESPLTIGQKKRADELALVYNAIEAETFYVLDCFVEYLNDKAFIVPAA